MTSAALPEFTFGTLSGRADYFLPRNENRARKVPYRLGDFGLGVARAQGPYFSPEDLRRQAANEGVQTRGGCKSLAETGDTWPPVLSYPVTYISSVSSDEDIRTFVATGRRVHGLNIDDNAGNGSRFYMGFGTKIYSPAQNAATPSGAVDTLTDEITCAMISRWGGLQYTAFATDNSTNSLVGNTDAGDATLITPFSGGTTLFAYPAVNDYIAWMASLPTLGPGFNVYGGKLNGEVKSWYTKFTDATGTLPSPVLSASSSALAPSYELNVQGKFAGTGADDSSIGTTSWTNPGNVTALDATNATQANPGIVTTHYLKGTNYGFAVPTGAKVVGAAASVYCSANGGGTISITSVRLVDNGGTISGKNLPVSPEVINNGGVTLRSAQTFGSRSENWGLDLTPTMVNDSDFGFVVSFALTDINDDVAVDAMYMTVWYIESTAAILSQTATGTWATQHPSEEISEDDTFMWDNSENVKVDDGTVAVTTFTTADTESSRITLHDFNFTVPSEATVIGAMARVQKRESNAAANAVDLEAAFSLNLGSTLGTALHDASTEWPTTLTDFYYGAANNTVGLALTPTVVNSSAFSFCFRATLAANTVEIDFMSVTVYYQMPENSVALEDGMVGGGGGTGAGSVNPFRPTRVGYLGNRGPGSGAFIPASMAKALHFIDYTYDAENDLLVGEKSSPTTGMEDIWDFDWWLGGCAVTGDQTAVTGGSILKNITAAGELQNLDFPGQWYIGSTQVVPRINMIKGMGTSLLLHVLMFNTSDVIADQQFWVYQDGEYYPDFPLQSKTMTTLPAQPLPWGSRALNTGANGAVSSSYPTPGRPRVYTVIPSSTDTHFTHQFIPPNLYADPRGLWPGEAKAMAFAAGTENAAIKVRSPEVAPWEDPKLNVAILNAAHLGRNLSASSTVTLKIDTGGDASITSAELSRLFDNAAAGTAGFLVAGADYRPTNGVAARSLIYQLELAHTAANAATPDGGPIELVTVQQEVMDEHEVTLAVYPSGMAGAGGSNVYEWLNAARTLQNSRVVQPLKWGDRTWLASLEEVSMEFRETAHMPSRGEPITATQFLRGKDDTEQGVILLRFRAQPGLAGS